MTCIVTTCGCPDPNSDRLLTVAEYAAKWRYGDWTIREYCKAGRIPGAENPGARWRIPADARILPAKTAKPEKPAENWFITQRINRKKPNPEDAQAAPPSMSSGRRKKKAPRKPASPMRPDDAWAAQ